MDKNTQQPAKRQKANVLQPHKFRTYKEIASLSAVKLKELCLSHNVDISLPKKAKIVFLCHTLGITTTGANSTYQTSLKIKQFDSLSSKQSEELQRLTPKVLYTLPMSEWSTDLKEIPDIDDTTVKKYLLQTNVLNKSSSRTYKLTRPFMLKQSVHSVRYYKNLPSDTFGVISARCNPSQGTNPDEIKVLHIIIDKITGEPYSAYCTCTVGFSETCGHVGAVLFRIADLVANGVGRLENQPTCTETLSAWIDPKGSKAEPDTFDMLKVKKKDFALKRTSECFGKKVGTSELPTYSAVSELHLNLINATHHLGQYCPAVHVLKPSRFHANAPDKEPLIPIELEDRMSEDNTMLAYSKEITVTTTPLPLLDIEHKVFKSAQDLGFENERQLFLKKAKRCLSSPDEIDECTKGQSQNPEWFVQRKGCITATKFGDVLKVIEKGKDSTTLVDVILGKKKTDHLSKVASIKWGRKNEDKARRQYVGKFDKWHKNLNVEQHGLMVSKDCNFVRGSPDGIVTCDCHPDMKRLLEIKCPSSAKNMKIAEGVAQKKIKYLEKGDVYGKYKLKPCATNGYYEQIQGLLGITGIKLANLVVWTKVDMVIVPVEFDPDFYYKRLIPACETFFMEHIIPQILINPDISSCDPKDEHPVVIVDSTPNCPLGSTNSNDTQLLTTLKTCIVTPDLDATAPDVGLSNEVYRCKKCQKLLPDDGSALEDNSNASVGCDCPNCGGCNAWYCWPCARYTEEWVEENIDWFCPECTRECDIVY